MVGPVILAACVVVSAGATAYAGSNLGVALREAYDKYVEEHRELYAYGDPIAFETPDGDIIVVNGSSSGEGGK